MKRKLLFISSLILAALIAIGCSKEGAGTDPTPTPGPDPTPSYEPTSAQLKALSDFITAAYLIDDYCTKLEGTDKSFKVTLFSGKSHSMDAKFPIVAEGGSTSGLKNYVVDGKRYAEFTINGMEIKLPSDIHQWFNPSVPSGMTTMSVLFIGDEYCEDATAILPTLVDSTNVSTFYTGRAIVPQVSLGNLITDFETANWCKYSDYYSKNKYSDPDWSIVMENNSSIKEAVQKVDWNVIVIGTSILSSEGWTYSENVKTQINTLLGNIFTLSDSFRPSVVLMLPCALPAAHQLVIDNFGGSQIAMFNAITGYGSSIAENTPVFDFVSVAAAMQNLRTSSLIYTTKNDLTRDGARIDCGVGCYAASGLLYTKFVEGCMNDVTPLFENKARWPYPSSEEGQISTEVTDGNVIYCRYAASKAATAPFVISDLSSLTPSIGGGEVPGVNDNEYPTVL